MSSAQDKELNKFWDFLSFFVSAIFSPYIVAVVFIALVVYVFSSDIRQFLPWMAIALVFDLVIPGCYVLWLMEKEHIRDIHLPDHEQRKIPFLITAVSSIIGALALVFIHAAKPVVVMGVVYAVNASVVALLTLYWKVSIHAVMLSSIVTIAVVLFGVQYAWLYLILVLICWARVYRRRHSVRQVVGGALISFIFTSIVFWLFGYI